MKKICIMAGVALAILTSGCTGIFSSESKSGEKKQTYSTLTEAARYGDFDQVKVLVSHGADVAAPDKHGRSPLHFAAMSGKLEIVQYLVSHGAPVNHQDDRGRAPLHIAAQLKNEEIQKYLIEHGADRTLQDIYGRIPGDQTKISRKEMNARKREERNARRNKSVRGGRKIQFR